MSERFRQFQALFPEEACLAELMRLRHGGTIMACAACGRAASFEMRPKLRGFACNHCHYMIHPAAGTPMESRRTPLQLWFFALKTVTEHPAKGAAAMIARDAGVPQMTAQRLVDELATLGERDDAAWLAGLRRLVSDSAASPAPERASGPTQRPAQPAKAAERAGAAPAAKTPDTGRPPAAPASRQGAAQPSLDVAPKYPHKPSAMPAGEVHDGPRCGCSWPHP